MIATQYLLLVAVAMPQDSHTPTYTVSGQTVTIDAEIAWIDQRPPNSTYALTTGTKGPHLDLIGFNSADVHGNLVWQLTPGEWTMTLMGHADDLQNPNRQVQQVTFTVSGPTREEAILANVIAYLTAKRDLAIMEPPPTQAEMLTAVIEAVTNRGL